MSVPDREADENRLETGPPAFLPLLVGEVRGAIRYFQAKYRYKSSRSLVVNVAFFLVRIQSRMLFDYLIVGAGFAGSVLAERLASQARQKVLLIDRRTHVGGNAYDHYNSAGILIQKYGPHIFHTNSREVFEYLSQFTHWRPYEHRVLARVDGQLLPIPINLNTINQLYGLNLTSSELEKFFVQVAEPRKLIRTSEDVVISKIGRELYEKFFCNYTRN